MSPNLAKLSSTDQPYSPCLRPLSDFPPVRIQKPALLFRTFSFFFSFLCQSFFGVYIRVAHIEVYKPFLLYKTKTVTLALFHCLVTVPRLGHYTPLLLGGQLSSFSFSFFCCVQVLFFVGSRFLLRYPLLYNTLYDTLPLLFFVSRLFSCWDPLKLYRVQTAFSIFFFSFSQFSLIFSFFTFTQSFSLRG
jgi:hypothetical protein